MAEELFFNMQWLTPLQLTSRTKSQVVCNVTDCKILQTPGTGEICCIGCRGAGTAYAADTLKLKRVTEPSEHGCTITLIPLTHHLANYD